MTEARSFLTNALRFAWRRGFLLAMVLGGAVAYWYFISGLSTNPPGFYLDESGGAYNAYLILTITQLPRQFTGFAERPVSTLIGCLLGVGLFAYIWYVRTRIFPDFNFIAPKKMNGKYVFSE